MKVTFDTQNASEVKEVTTLLALLGEVSSEAVEVIPAEAKAETPTKPKRAPTKGKGKVDVKKDVEKPVEKKVEETTKDGITLADLKESAKNAVARTDRDKVKETIGEFAPKLAEVAEADYGKLYKKLQELS